MLYDKLFCCAVSDYLSVLIYRPRPICLCCLSKIQRLFCICSIRLQTPTALPHSATVSCHKRDNVPKLSK